MVYAIYLTVYLKGYLYIFFLLHYRLASAPARSV